LTDANAIIERLRELFVDRFHVEVPSSDADLLEAGILDSFQFVELLLELEHRFGLRIKLEDIELDDLRTLARIARLVAINSAAAGALQPPSSRAAA
jgi:D-alanine--poly(phosphoribitol) ligase subunit 2